LRRAFDTAVWKEVRKRLQTNARKGMQEGIKKIVLLQLKKRFGRLPASVTKRLDGLSDAQAEKLALAILDAKSLKDLFPPVAARR
jgi:hypothetical protein